MTMQTGFGIRGSQNKSPNPNLPLRVPSPESRIPLFMGRREGSALSWPANLANGAPQPPSTHGTDPDRDHRPSETRYGPASTLPPAVRSAQTSAAPGGTDLRPG